MTCIAQKQLRIFLLSCYDIMIIIKGKLMKTYFLIFFSSIISNCQAMEKPLRKAKDIIRIRNIITIKNETPDSYKIHQYTEKKFPQGSLRLNFVKILPNQEKKIVIKKSPFAPLSLGPIPKVQFY